MSTTPATRSRTALRKRPPSVELSRSQSSQLADRLAVFATGKARYTVAAEIGVKEHVISDVLARKAKVTMTRPSFEALITKLGVDAGGWDVSGS